MRIAAPTLGEDLVAEVGNKGLAAWCEDAQREPRRPQDKKEEDRCGRRGRSPERESKGQRRMPLRADTIQERTSQASTRSKPMEQDQLHHGEHREEEDRCGRRGRSPECESKGQRRMPLRADTIQEGTRQASSRSKPLGQDQLHHGKHRKDEGPGGRRGRSPECESKGQRRTPPRADPIQERTRQVSTRSEMPGQVQLRREGHREEEEQPQPRVQHRPPLARRIRRAEEEPLGESAPRTQPAEEPAAWAKSQTPRAREAPGGESQWKKKDTPQPVAPAEQQQEVEGKIAQWKGGARSFSQKRKINNKRTRRRQRITAKWAKDDQQHEAPESDASERGRRSRRGAAQEPANSPEPNTRGRSRRPRDARSQSRSHSARRSPRR